VGRAAWSGKGKRLTQSSQRHGARREELDEAGASGGRAEFQGSGNCADGEGGRPFAAGAFPGRRGFVWVGGESSAG